jgi:hypothetical protein
MHLHVDPLTIHMSSESAPKRPSPMQMLNCGMCVDPLIDAPYPRARDNLVRISIHLFDQFVDLVFSVAQITTFDKVLELPLVEATSRAVQLERPQEVGRLLEVGADGVNLVDQILHTDHAVLAEVLLDDFVVSQRKSLLVNLAIPSLCGGVSIVSLTCIGAAYCR